MIYDKTKIEPKTKIEQVETAKRDAVSYRYDILDWDFIELMAKIASYGATKYGDYNWKRSRLTGEKGAMNHLMNHYRLYQIGRSYDHKEVGTNKSIHLAAIAFNAMMEYFYCKEEEE
jgi:hypothetical protein